MWTKIYEVNNFIFEYDHCRRIMILYNKNYPNIINKVFYNVDIRRVSIDFMNSIVEQLISDSYEAMIRYNEYIRGSGFSISDKKDNNKKQKKKK